MYPHHVFNLEPAGTSGMYPICYQCHRFCSLWLLYTMILSTSTTVDLYPFFIGHYPLSLLPQFPSAFPLFSPIIPSPPYPTTPVLRVRAVEQAVVYSTSTTGLSTLTFRGGVVAEGGGVEERSEVMYWHRGAYIIYYRDITGHSCIAWLMVA